MKKTTLSIIALAIALAIIGSVALVATADNFAENGWLFDSPDKTGLTDEEKSAIREELSAKEIADKEAAKNTTDVGGATELTEEEKEILRRQAEYAAEEAAAWQEIIDTCLVIVEKHYPDQYKKPDVKYYNTEVFSRELDLRELLLLCIKNDKLDEEEQMYCACGLYMHMLAAEGKEHDRIEEAIDPWLHPADEEEAPPAKEESSR